MAVEFGDEAAEYGHQGKRLVPSSRACALVDKV